MSRDALIAQAQVGSGAMSLHQGRREALEAMLYSVQFVLAGIAGALPAVGSGLLVVCAVLAALWLHGRSTLTLSFAATERALVVRGRNVALIEFAEAFATRLAEQAPAR